MESVASSGHSSWHKLVPRETYFRDKARCVGWLLWGDQSCHSSNCSDAKGCTSHVQTQLLHLRQPEGQNTGCLSGIKSFHAWGYLGNHSVALAMSHTGDPEKLTKVSLLNILLQNAEDRTLCPSSLLSFTTRRYVKIHVNKFVTPQFKNMYLVEIRYHDVRGFNFLEKKNPWIFKVAKHKKVGTMLVESLWSWEQQINK